MNEELIKRIIELTKLDKKTLVERALKATEEMGELAQAVLSYSSVSGCSYKKLTSDHVLEESVDGLMLLLSIIAQVYDYDIDEESLMKVLNTKLDKWESKIKNDKESVVNESEEV